MQSHESKKPEKARSEVSAGVSVIPLPVKMTAGEGAFRLTAATAILSDDGVGAEARYLAEVLTPATGLKLAVRSVKGDAPKSNCIVLRLDASRNDLGDEGYVLTVSKDRVEVSAPKPAGVFYAIQTLRQLMPPEVLSSEKVAGVEWTIPCVEIEDKPRFAWRGQLFDVCRHFFDVNTVKRQIDLLALHKVNRLHWHLTEDQGWRIEIKKYPKLAEVGAWRTEKDGSRYGGYYTQAQVKEVIAYAASRHMLVVPEIEMPGHSRAALASYPHLGCTGGPYEVANLWGVFDDVYCAGNDQTFAFLQDVLDEVMGLFPSPYIHIGGDEVPKTKWKACEKCQTRIATEKLKDEAELQSYFIRRIDQYLTGKGRRLIGWDEILEGGLAEGAVVQSWRGVKGGIEAAEAGHDVIMSPTSHCYLDYGYATTSLEKSYGYEPIPEELSADKAKHVLGLEGNLWAERVPNQGRLDFQVFPRMTALAEVGWSPKEARNWDDFSNRMKTHVRRYEVLGVRYGFDDLGDIESNTKVIGEWKADQMSEAGVTLEWDVTKDIDAAGKYEFIFIYKTGQAGISIEWAALTEDSVEIGRDTHEGWSGIDKRDVVYRVAVPERKPIAVYKLKARVASVGGTNSNGEVRVRKAK